MKRLISLIGRLFLTGCLLMVFLTPPTATSQALPAAGAAPSTASPAYPLDTIIVDGVIDAAYGPPIASDPAGDGNSNANMDLLDLYVAEDASNFYFAFSVNANLATSNWGKYVIYIDSDGVAGSGATQDAWARNVVTTSAHRPEYGLYSWVDCAYNASCTQFWGWSGSSWSQSGSLDEAAMTAGSVSTIEWRVAKSRLGNPSNFWLEVWSTGGGDNDNAQDTINDPPDDWNANDWSSQATLMLSTPYPALQYVSLSLSSPPEGAYTVDPEIQVSGTVSPTIGVMVTIDVNEVAVYTPTVSVTGDFNQIVQLSPGANRLTIIASDGIHSASAVRNVQRGAGQDNQVLLSQLAHDSRNPLYRSPGGALETSTPVKLRLRAASGDLTEALVRIWNDRVNSQSILAMQVVADDGMHEWWEATLPTSALLTVYWYRFIAIDGSHTVYYEDDGARDGGLGQAYSSSMDRSWQLSIYHPDFSTPDWVKNAVIYQIFTDRFRNGDPSNDTPAGTFFYDEPGGTIYRSNQSNWNVVVCDPRQLGTDCSGTYSKNFYGGDLQGILNKLDYLEDLGVTALYLNPIFESPSNHKYDTTDYSLIDDNFGDLTLFQELVNQAGLRGIRIILDGVFNHTSSDSIYFDRYGRYTNLGACESPASPYRDWYIFTDVAPGMGACAASDGTPNAAQYESWFGYDSLPKLNAANPEVRDLIWSGDNWVSGEDAVARYWVQWADGWRLDVAGDVDPGTINDPANDYWEGFRQAVRATNPDTYIVGEEWGNAISWLLGDEWDATMNYQYSGAILSFWRDKLFEDNDHNPASSAGVLTPLTPSQLDARLHNWRERYPAEAYYAMMNLLGSHDTNRPLFMLDHNTDLNDDSIYQNPDYDWGDAIQRLKGVVALQMTLPGAPTVYYGDEVGLVGPVAFIDYGGGNAKWEDDPYNRQPFPWLDETGAPFYTHLQTQQAQDDLRDYYKLLTSARNAHAALRTGSFDTLLVDDANKVYAYGRLLEDYSDAAVVIANRNPLSQTIEVDLKGYLPYGASLENVLANDALYTVNGNGKLPVPVPGMSAAVLVLAGPVFAPPAVATDLEVTSESGGSVGLSWTAGSGATSYLVLRSLLSGGGYALVGTTDETTFNDSGLEDGQRYYYVVASRDNASGLEGSYSNEVEAIPHQPILWGNVQSPAVIHHEIGLTATPSILARVSTNRLPNPVIYLPVIYKANPIPGAVQEISSRKLLEGLLTTHTATQAQGMRAQVGFGPPSTPPSLWTDWVEAAFDSHEDGFDIFSGQLLPEYTGSFAYVYRFSNTSGRDWVYAGLNGILTPDAPARFPGTLHVTPSSDTTPPGTPQNLRLTDWSADYITLAWDEMSGDLTLYAYDVFRGTTSGTAGTKIARVSAASHVFSDTGVTTGESYYYRIQALDTSFNRSDFSNEIEATPQAKLVSVTFRVRVPDYTPGTVYIAGDLPGIPQWNPGANPMNPAGTNLWEITLDLPDGTSGMYKYTRGNWETVESWGTITGLANRHVLIQYGPGGTQLVDDTATDWGVGPDDHKAVGDWRDPIVVGFVPADGAVNVPVTSTIRVTWSHTMTTSTDFSVNGPTGVVTGTFSYEAGTNTTVFQPGVDLQVGATYTVTVTGQVDAGGNQQQVPVTWSFTTQSTFTSTSVAPTRLDFTLGEIHIRLRTVQLEFR